VLSSDCMASVESYITLCRIQGEGVHTSKCFSPVFSVCSCKRAVRVFLHGVHRNSCTFTIVWRNDFIIYVYVIQPAKNEGNVESCNSVSSYSTVLCQNKECHYLMISIEHGAWKPLCMLVFLLCNAHQLSLSLSFPSALAL